MKDLKLDALRSIDLFTNFSKKELELLGRITERAEIPAGKTIVVQDTVATHMVLLTSGKASVAVDGREVARLGSGDVVGELSLVDRKRASATVKAEEDCSGWLIAQGTFRDLWKANPEISVALLEAVVSRLRATNDLLV